MESLPKFAGLMDYIHSLGEPGRLKAGSMGAAIFEAAERGQIRADQCAPLLISYLLAGMDTTINSISNAVWLFSLYPTQWDMVRNDTSLIPMAFEEVVRFESPILSFKRVLSRNYSVDGTDLAAGDGALMLYASANRDDRKWKDPERFDVRRNPVDHLGFGYGLHGCAGQALARLEAHALLTALAQRVVRFTTGEPTRRLNNIIRGFKSLPVTVHTS
jgi:cytochrome P450